MYNFPVTEKNVQVSGGKNIPGIKVIVKEEDGTVLSKKPVSSKYKVVTHMEVVEGFEEALGRLGKEFANPEITTVLPFDGARMHRKYKFPNIHVNFGKDAVTGKKDDVYLCMELQNSYDGVSKVGYNYGAFRKVCENGLMVHEKFQEIMKKHFASINVSELAEGLKSSVEVFQDNATKWTEWKGLEIPVMEAQAFLKKSQAPEKVQQRILERYDIEEHTKFGLFQAITWDITHNVKARKNEANTRLNQMKLEDVFAKLLYTT